MAIHKGVQFELCAQLYIFDDNKGQGSRRVKIGPVSTSDKIWLYCVGKSSVTENDIFKSLACYLGICDVIKITYPTRRF